VLFAVGAHVVAHIQACPAEYESGGTHDLSSTDRKASDICSGRTYMVEGRHLDPL
jgi:hypothetical protein